MYATYVRGVAWLRRVKTCDCASMLTVPAGRKYHSAQPVMPTLSFLNPWRLGGVVLMWECVIVPVSIPEHSLTPYFSITGRLFSTSPRRSSLSWPTDPRSHPTTWSRYVRSWWPLRHSGKPWPKSTWKKRHMPSSKRPGEWQKPGLWASSLLLPGQATFNHTTRQFYTSFSQKRCQATKHLITFFLKNVLR